jgi:hypothetical protein
MILKFPNLNTVRLAMTASVMPAAVVQAPVVGGFDDQGRLWVECKGLLARTVQSELRRIGVVFSQAGVIPVAAEFGSWLELVPLQPDPKPPDHPEQLPVVFDLASGEELSRVIFEILRLGNDRQSFRWLGSDDGDARALLRVVGPPYYSLLRAIDRDGKASDPVAYIERAPDVWVELGQTHPLLDLIKPPAGKLLFLRAPREWTLLDNVPFRDIYDEMEFALPDRSVAWRDKPMPAKMIVPLTLRSGGPLTGAQLWELTGDAEAELNRFVQNADERLLTDLAFAVGERDGRTTIVVRARHSRSAPPELVLSATPYRCHQGLPNLFLPLGAQLHPPLRRDVVRKLLADDTDCVVWLAPGDDGSFTPQQIPENAFRPLTDWVAYVLDRAAEPLQAWMQALRFDFEPFVCDEDTPEPKKPREPQEKRPKGRKERAVDSSEPIPGSPAVDPANPTEKVLQTAPVIEFAADLAPMEPAAAQQELRATEEQFRSCGGDLDAPERRKLWPQLARLNAAVSAPADAGLCWLSAMWFHDEVPAAWARAWLQVETAATPNLDAILSLSDPTAADLRPLAAYVVWASVQAAPPQPLLDRLHAVQRFLEKHEGMLPVRAVWLVWRSLVRLVQGDMLALARARDRLLERLYQSGLRPETDLPGFLRFFGRPTHQPYLGLRQWLTQLCELAHMWAEENGHRADNDEVLPVPTRGYIDLLFAFGLARLGEHDACRALLRRGAEHLRDKAPVHVCLQNAFEYRIRQALEGKPHTGPLPDEQRQAIRRLPRKDESGFDPRYVADRLLCQLRVLDPDQESDDPYRHIYAKSNPLERSLVELTDLVDRGVIAAGLEALWQNSPNGAKGDTAREQILREALNQAPRVGEEFARKMLGRTATLLESAPFPPPGDYEIRGYVKLLEKALLVAAHFDRVEHLQSLVARFKVLLELRVRPAVLRDVVTTANRCFRSLRRIGMREDVEGLLSVMDEVVLGGRDPAQINPSELAGEPNVLLALLELAGGWYSFGRNAQAQPILDVTRALLIGKEIQRKSPDNHKLVTCAYVAAVGQGPVDLAEARLEDLLTHLRGVRDEYAPSKYQIRQRQLEVIDAVILAMTRDDFALGASARRWLEDDELLVRKRIHQDVRAVLLANS